MTDAIVPTEGLFLGRANVPGHGFPRVVTVRDGRVVDITAKAAPTVRDICEMADPAGYVASAEGKAVKPAAGLPTVKVEPGQQATFSMPKNAKAPTKTVRQPLIEGTGPKVKSGQTVRVAYTGAVLSTGKVFDSSLKRGQAFTFVTGGGGVIEGWDKGVTGQTVGSRIELVIPASLAYKDQAQGDIPANSTLVFVIDILDAGVGSQD